MISYIVFHAYLALALFSVIISLRALTRKDYETPAVMLLLFLCSLIGLASTFRGFIRVFSGIYGIEWSG